METKIEKAFVYLKEVFDKQYEKANVVQQELLRKGGFDAIENYGLHAGRAVEIAGYGPKMIDAFMKCKPYCFNLSNKLDTMLKERYGYGE